MAMRLSYLVHAALAVTAKANHISARQSNGTNQTIVTSFKDVPTTQTIEWIPCFGNFTCTNLEVPLDYEDRSVGTTNVAFIKYDAPKQPARGDILYNPGGPGDSAVGFFLRPDHFSKLPMVLGDEWNIIGMDPRGINNSGPHLDCFKGLPIARDEFDRTHTDVDFLSPRSVEEYFVSTGGFGDWCSAQLSDDTNYANTPAIAGDMLHYFELLAESQGLPREDVEVNYYGVSYGSLLGDTFAQLYPDRVGKFILDANVDGEDYYWGSWNSSLRQSDDAVKAFFEYCFEAGPKCAFFANDTSAEAMQGRLDKMIADLEETPIPVTDPYFVQYPVVVTHLTLKTRVLGETYNWYNWPQYASDLAELEKGNATMMAVATQMGLPITLTLEEYSSIQPRILTACTDSHGRYNVSTLEQLQDLYAQNKAISKYFGAQWTQVIVPQCRKLRFTPPEHQTIKGKPILPL
ncbi:hypothetical protein BS50DRAFT_237824 [Corynespora cassiicola Philippines]|uniref:AB hydrolase-1 domain-containing protein n=1 Tax=Corynespora cassiicola Philippines TaxID=1448308 RepID=A0A2T2P2I9_CORCC|nr:hypothetical protein BS50DRAFT_237824 [Corynespora cassiicola Philippines]